MMRTNYSFLFLIISFFFISTAIFAQTANFDETWKEFLKNDKISNMSELTRPDKKYDQLDYAKYLLMNTNSNFCQSKMDGAESLMAEIKETNIELHRAIPGFVERMDNLEIKMKAYHSIDMIWKQFLLTKEVTPEELDVIKGAKMSCEKRTLAKYSYMMAYYHLCEGSISEAKNIFENRTLRLTEKTSLRVRDVEGLAAEVARMKTLFEDIDELEVSWRSYVETGVSPGYDKELPLFTCYPIPNIKVFVLRGMVDVCNLAPTMLEEIKKLQAESGVTFDRELAGEVKALETAIEQNKSNLAILNEAWEAFIPDNKVKHMGQYTYEYCTTEPLIKAYIMDGFAYTCEMAEGMLDKIAFLQSSEGVIVEEITQIKINELEELNQQYQSNGREIERLWNKFIAQGDVLTEDYETTEFYCDNIHQVKSWTIKGLSGTCEEGHQYLEQIEEFQHTFDFLFFKELECRVQKLRIKVWGCRHEALLKLARIEAPDSYEERLAELMEEYGMGEQPEVCSLED